jgi:hypothetical protein
LSLRSPGNLLHPRGPSLARIKFRSASSLGFREKGAGPGFLGLDFHSQVAPRGALNDWIYTAMDMGPRLRSDRGSSRLCKDEARGALSYITELTLISMVALSMANVCIFTFAVAR